MHHDGLVTTAGHGFADEPLRQKKVSFFLRGEEFGLFAFFPVQPPRLIDPAAACSLVDAPKGLRLADLLISSRPLQSLDVIKGTNSMCMARLRLPKQNV
jgi:hypothetical protein